MTLLDSVTSEHVLASKAKGAVKWLQKPRLVGTMKIVVMMMIMTSATMTFLAVMEQKKS